MGMAPGGTSGRGCWTRPHLAQELSGMALSVAAAFATAPRSPNGHLRIALISTPRAGNNWLRHLLTRLFDLPSQPVHSAHAMDWEAFPAEGLLAIHWHPTPAFLDRLREEGFQPIVLARHPLDVLISILHFAL